MSLTDALGSITLKIHSLRISSISLSYLSRSKLDKYDVIIYQPHLTFRKLQLASDSLQLEAFRVDCEVFHLFVIRNLLKLGKARTSHLQSELKGIFVCEISATVPVFSRSREIIKQVRICFDRD